MTRQERELIDALARARRCAGRAESRARLAGDPTLAFVFVGRTMESERDRLDDFRRAVYELRAAA